MSNNKQKYKLSDHLFIAKISFFNTAIFLMIFAFDTYTFLLRNQSGKTLSYYVLFLALPIFIINYLFLRFLKSPILKSLLPYLFTVVACVIISLVHFGDPIFHLSQTIAFFLYLTPAIVAVKVRETKIDTSFVDNQAMPLSAKIEWIKQQSDSWRKTAFTGGVAYFSSLGFILAYLYSRSAIVFTSSEDRVRAWGIYAFELVFVGFYIISGPVLELLSKSRGSQRLLLDLKEKAK